MDKTDGKAAKWNYFPSSAGQKKRFYKNVGTTESDFNLCARALNNVKLNCDYPSLIIHCVIVCRKEANCLWKLPRYGTITIH